MFVGDNEYDFTAYINFLPVCSRCRKIIDRTIGIDEMQYGVPYSDISPRVCPNCGAIFTTIHIPTRLPFTEDEYWNSTLIASRCI